MDGLLIGRFQPFHLGHLEAVRFALSCMDRLWLGIGSSNRQPEKDNPFTAGERRLMIKGSLGAAAAGVRIYDIPDLEDHKKWMESIDGIVPPYGAVFSNDGETGRLYSGRGIEVVRIPFIRRDELSGTNIRGRILGGLDWQHLVPPGSRKVLESLGARARLQGL